MRPILLIFAHPDDESSTMAGTTTRYSDMGVPVDLICATRGEKGTRLGVPDGVETGIAREQGLRAVGRITGLRRIHFLGYVDSELAFADPSEVAARILDIMRDDPPQVVVTFGPDGISGHSDHVAIGRAATAAFEQMAAGDPGLRKLYYVTIPQSALADIGDFDVGTITTRTDDEITTVIDISGFLDRKIKALEAHSSQADAQELADILRQGRDINWAHHEYLYLARGTANGRETDLLQ
jgi:LmbE family N-acetylglucosaminyl deacetylase